MKIIKKLFCVILCAVCLSAVSIPAFAVSAYGDLYGLSEEEKFNIIYEQVKSGWQGLEASLMHDELQEFVSNLEVSSMDYDVKDGYEDFIEWYEKKYDGMEINRYNEKVIAYLREHPDAELRWVGSSDSYSISDVHNLNPSPYIVDQSDDDYHYDPNAPLMQYNQKDLDNMIIWTYDKEKTQYVGKNTDGKVVKTVYAYSQPFGISEISEETSEKSDAVTASSNTYSDSAVAVDETYPETTDNYVSVESSAATVSQEVQEVVVDESVIATEAESKDNTGTTIIIIIGVLILIGIIVIIIMLGMRKRENNNGKQ